MATSTLSATAPSKTKSILLTWLVAGTLDMSGAILVYSVIMQKVGVTQLLEGIASGAFGAAAFNGGAMPFFGVLFHYTIALCWTVGYFLVYPYIPFLGKYKIISGLLYGILVWIVMNRVVLPLSNVQMGPFSWIPALRGAAILMVCIGLPISLLTSRYYEMKTRSQQFNN